MFPLLAQRTSNVISTILNNKCNYTLIYLRLYKQSNHRSLVDHARNKRTLNALQRFSKKYRHFVQYRKYGIETCGKNEINVISVEEHIPEHKVLHSMLLESIHYKDTIMPPIKVKMEISYDEVCQLYTVDWTNESALNIFNAIKTMSYCYLNGTCFETSLYNNILEGCNMKLQNLQDQQLQTLMQHLIVLNDECQKSDNWYLLLKTLNKECLKRFFPAPTDKLLLISDIFYQLGDQESYYMWRALRKIGTKPMNLSPKQLAQLFFLMTSCKTKYDINMYEVECRLQECLNELSGNEIGIIARGFFLTKRRVRNKVLIMEIIQKMRKNIQFMDSTTLAAIMKLIRYSDCYHCVAELQDLLKCLHTEILRLSLKCLIHIAHAFGATRIYDETLTKLILERVKNEIKFARLKDIERILFAICSITPPTNYYQEACQILLNEVALTCETSRAAEINKFPMSLVRILSYVTSKDIYILDLVQRVLEPSFVQNTYKHNMNFLTNDLLVLHCHIQIQFPYYKGPFLSKQMYSYLSKKYRYSDDVQKKDTLVKLRTEIVFLCKNNLGIDVCVDQILPHYTTRDIVFGIDEHNNSVEVEPILSSMPIGSIKYVNSEELKKIKWNVLFLLPTAVKVIGHTGYINFVYKRFKELRIIGYYPLPIYETDWTFLMDEKSKEDYLRQLIYEKPSQNFIDEFGS